jgi:hypothetical protein
MEMVDCQSCENGKPVKVCITIGLVALVISAALLVVVGQRMAPRIEKSLGLDSRQEYTPGGVSYDDGRTVPLHQLPVNERAGREVKRQQIASSPQPARPQPQPAPSGQLTAAPTDGKYSVTVFVGTDAKSQQLLDWWNYWGQLQELKRQVNFQAYTKDNTLYLWRYADLVPRDQFPAVIFADGTGGHVYFAAGDALPSSAATLYAEMYDALQIHRNVVQQSPASPVTAESSGSSPNCPDGNCPTPNSSGWKPLVNPDRKPLFPALHPKPKDPIESILYWLWNPGEALLAMLCGFVFFVLCVIVLMKVVRG